MLTHKPAPFRLNLLIFWQTIGYSAIVCFVWNREAILLRQWNICFPLFRRSRVEVRRVKVAPCFLSSFADPSLCPRRPGNRTPRHSRPGEGAFCFVLFMDTHRKSHVLSTARKCYSRGRAGQCNKEGLCPLCTDDQTMATWSYNESYNTINLLRLARLFESRRSHDFIYGEYTQGRLFNKTIIKLTVT